MAASTRSAPTAAKGARVAGCAGIVAASRCVLPLVFFGFGLGSVDATVIPTPAALRPYLLAAAVVVAVLGWLSVARGQRTASQGTACEVGAGPRRLPLWLGLGTAVVLLALIWQPVVEPRLLPWMR